MHAVSAGRRTFVRQVIAGVPALAGAVAVSPTAHAYLAVPARTPFAPHAGIEATLHRLAGLHNELLRRPPTVADVRVAGGHLRDLIGYRLDANRDADLRPVLQELIATHGRHTLAMAPPDLALLRAGLARYGLNASAVDFGSPSPEARAAALEMLARRGATFYFFEPLVMFETLAYILEENRSYCAELRDLSLIMEAATAVLCGVAQFFPPVAPECLAASLVVAVLKVLEVLNDC
jgi:hypothetical protein